MDGTPAVCVLQCKRHAESNHPVGIAREQAVVKSQSRANLPPEALEQRETRLARYREACQVWKCAKIEAAAAATYVHAVCKTMPNLLFARDS